HPPALTSVPTRRSSDLAGPYCRGDHIGSRRLRRRQVIQRTLADRIGTSKFPCPVAPPETAPYMTGHPTHCRRGNYHHAHAAGIRSEEHTSELQSRENLV